MIFENDRLKQTFPKQIDDLEIINQIKCGSQSQVHKDDMISGEQVNKKLTYLSLCTCLSRAKLLPFSPYTESIVSSGTTISTVVLVTMADLLPL